MLHPTTTLNEPQSSTDVPELPKGELRKEAQKPAASDAAECSPARVAAEEVLKEEEEEKRPEDCGRERLKRHRMEMAGRVWIPDMWGQEGLLKDWADCSVFDSSLVPNGVVSARKALVKECRGAASSGGVIRVENRC